MTPPLLSYVTFNRLGLTIQNLNAILESTDDFEMHIIDNNSKDGTWEFLNSLKDSRIHSVAQMPVNNGQIYAMNLNLLKRRPDQYFITVDNDVYIETKDWISRFMQVFDAFPEVGLLGVPKGSPYPKFFPPVKQNTKDTVSYFELLNIGPMKDQHYLPGCCQCLRPELIDQIGFWCEESGFGERELSLRVNEFTSFKVGFVSDIQVRMPQHLTCEACQYKDSCKLNKKTDTCFTIYNRNNVTDAFYQKYKWKFEEVLNDMRSGARSACRATALKEIPEGQVYNLNWALENFRYFIDNTN